MKVGIMLVTVTLGLSVTAATAGPGAFGAKRGLPPQLAEFDMNKDGVLDKTEREALKAAMEAKHKAFIAKYDKNGDGVLDKDELAAAKADREAALKAQRTKRFAEIDADGNGSITLAELTTALKGLSAARVQAVFGRLDANHDKAISLDEFLAEPPHPAGPHPGDPHK